MLNLKSNCKIEKFIFLERFLFGKLAIYINNSITHTMELIVIDQSSFVMENKLYDFIIQLFILINLSGKQLAYYLIICTTILTITLIIINYI